MRGSRGALWRIRRGAQGRRRARARGRPVPAVRPHRDDVHRPGRRSRRPFDERVDVAIDVHQGPESLALRELGFLCAERAGIPLVVAGSSRIEAGTEVALEGALDVAERLVVDADLKPPAYAVERAVRRELASLGRANEPVRVSYEEHDRVFDVAIESRALGPGERAALDAVVIPLFGAALREQRFGDTVYRSRGWDVPGSGRLRRGHQPPRSASPTSRRTI